MLFIILYLIAVVAASFSQVLLKKSALMPHSSRVKEYINVHVISGYALLAASMLLTVFAFKGLPYKIGPAIETLGYVMVLLLSRVFFREKFSKRKIVACVFIIAGVALFGLGS